MGWRSRFFTFVLSIFSLTGVFAASLPLLQGHINDYAQVLTEEQKASLEASLSKIERHEGRPQVVILTTRQMQGMSIEEYSMRVARSWGIGQKGKDNGLLITTYVAPGKNFKCRIEVGYGLEGLIPDATARAIYEHKMRPYFQKEGHENYMEAYSQAILAIDQLLSGESTGNELIDKAPEIESQTKRVQVILIFGAVVSLIAGYIHILASGLTGVLTSLVLGSVLGISAPVYLLFLLFGFLGGLTVHIVGKNFSGGFFFIGPGGGGFGGGGGGFSGGGGSFGGGGFTGGR